ncbi:conserved hypothetical protein [Rubrobacter radiotolerans DSM 5868]|nr:conserved hypothetical protein [Rubrobacter radiotolerans DSM 5868]
MPAARYPGAMAKLPNPEKAVVEMRKLRDYCLSPEHPRGRHKARVFASALGLTAEDSEELRDALFSAVVSEEAAPTEEDEYGKRYVLDFEMSTEAGSATVRSGWIVRSGEGFPRFTSCWVL